MSETTDHPIVYMYGMRASKPQESQEAKLASLAKAVGMAEFPWKNKLVAVKTHFGEIGSSSFPRPHLLRPIIDLIKSGGGTPFLAETSTLYSGGRSNAPKHIETAFRHGFGPEVTGAPIFICDGLTGREHIDVEIAGRHFQKVGVAAGIHEADALVVISHFKGHELTGFGGAIKNLGMGCCARAAKLAMHTSIRPTVKASRCVKCHVCFEWCPVGAIHQPKPAGPVVIDPTRCIGCGECLISCRVGAISINWDADANLVTERLVEHALGVMQRKRGTAFFFNLLQDIVPSCDCMSFSDAPIVPNIGFVASLDPLAIDAASLDLVNQQLGLPGTALPSDHQTCGRGKLAQVHPRLDVGRQLSYGRELGLGQTDYELKRLD